MTPTQAILLILADGDARERAVHHLRQQGFSVFATGDVRIALDWLTRHTPDLIVCDLLPSGTRAAIEQVLRRKAGSARPRIVALAREGVPLRDRVPGAAGYDEVVSDRTPLAVLTKRLLAPR